MNKNFKPEVQLFWFKRDLRLHDHGPLELWQQSSTHNPSQNNLGLFVVEEDYWKSEKASESQRQFVVASALELQQKLKSLGGELLILKDNSSLEAIKKLNTHLKINKIICHRETGNQWTFNRDKKIIRFCKDQGIEFIEIAQDPLVRGARTKVNDFSNRYYNFATSRQFALPTKLKSIDITSLNWLNTELGSLILRTPENFHKELNLIQRPGETQAIESLMSFLDHRCLGSRRKGDYGGYRREMSIPLVAKDSCSRISSHLTWGTLSARSSYQTAINALNCLDSYDQRTKHIQSFITRLAWRSHFMQKFETLHWMEFQCLNKSSENLHGWDQDAFEAWANGMTGYPFVDACMRSLNATKWLNFRARAMVVSFASYALNLDWRGFGPHLAKNFLDYEPGIHYSQLQMQGGTTLGSPPRIYSPLKQSIEKDPTGDFIRLWVPELRDSPNSIIHMPLDYQRNGYPPSIVDNTRLWSIMRSNAPKSPKSINSRFITKKMGVARNTKKVDPSEQLELSLGLGLELEVETSR